ncbi:MAG: serine/threonine protein kinase [Pirellulaceae bacterium]|nr:serine/threonine protein kinase [Pirellulaceae bacterium]
MPLQKLGPYRLDRVLGRGGMGSVYVGVNGETGERAAIKVLAPHLVDDANFVERFKIEVETLKKLLHPNIVQLFAYGEEDGNLFYVMELVEGRSLQDELQAGRRFTWREVARIGIDIAKALKHAHDRGIIHRDLKPANLLMDDQEHVKLADFGIAKLYGGTQITADGGVLGTADYMSPEQAEGKQSTSRCDLYSLGSVLYALLVGRPPFAGKTLHEVIQNLRFEKPIAIRRINPEIPEEFESIIMQLLEKEPQKRIPTAVALAKRLRAMEHALSMETLGGSQPAADLANGDEEEDDGELRLEPEPGATRSSVPKTAFPLSIRPTMPMPSPRKTDIAPNPAGVHTVITGLGNAGGDGHRASAEGDDDVELSPPAPRPTHFTTVSEAELRRGGGSRDDEPAISSWIWLSALLAVAVLVIAGVVWYANRPPSADQLYSRVKAVADDGDSQTLVAIEPELLKFLASFPADPRVEEMQQFQEEIELGRLQKRFELRASRNVASDALSPIERAYMEAVRLTGSDPDAALAKFQALVDVYGTAPEIGGTPVQRRTNQQCIDLARKQIERLQSANEKTNAAQRELIQEQLARAATLHKTDPTAARKIYRGIVELYRNKPWAADLVKQAEASGQQ